MKLSIPYWFYGTGWRCGCYQKIYHKGETFWLINTLRQTRKHNWRLSSVTLNIESSFELGIITEL